MKKTYFEFRAERMSKIDKTKKIKKIMENALEATNNWVCHDDIPEFVEGFTDHFTVYGEEDEPVYLIAILRVET